MGARERRRSRLPRNQSAAARDFRATHTPEGAGARDFLAIRAPPLETSSHLKCPRAPPLETSSHPRDAAHSQKTESRGGPRNVSIPNLKISDSLLFFSQAPRGTSEKPPLKTSSQLRRPRAPPLETSSQLGRRRSRLPRNQGAAARDFLETRAPPLETSSQFMRPRAPALETSSQSERRRSRLPRISSARERRRSRLPRTQETTPTSKKLSPGNVPEM